MAKNTNKREQTVEVTRCFGGGFDLTIDGEHVGIFGTTRAAHEFAASYLLASSRTNLPRIETVS